ncbi:hypothetical protein K3724_03175 [Leisingera sp. M658]|nr:hypothetical protein [Leisingera sp. M658]UWQ75483.1 hypothetical protein K3724_03175 [Leisingera sp. M658]
MKADETGRFALRALRCDREFSRQRAIEDFGGQIEIPPRGQEGARCSSSVSCCSAATPNSCAAISGAASVSGT